jgi:hypothetical protein
LWTVLYGIPRLSAISCIVSPLTVIYSVSETISKNIIESFYNYYTNNK